MDGRMNGWKDGWLVGWMDERMDGWMKEFCRRKGAVLISDVTDWLRNPLKLRLRSNGRSAQVFLERC